MSVAAMTRTATTRVMLLAIALVAFLLVRGSFAGAPPSVLSAHPPCDAGTPFFGSATEGTMFGVGDSWQGGTFTSIGLDANMVVREENAHLVGKFSPTRAFTATIEFDRTVHVTAIFWWDNDPKSGESGWSVNGVSGPVTGEDGDACTAVDLTTDTITIDGGGDSGGIDFWFEEVAAVTATPTPTPEGTVAGETPTPTPSPTASPTPTPMPEQSVQGGTPTPSPTPEQTVQGGAGTPAPSVPDTASRGVFGTGSLAAMIFAFWLLVGLAGLATAQVVSRRRQR